MDNVKLWHNETVGLRVIEALKKNGFKAAYLKSSKEARDYVGKEIEPGMEVAFGGSMTIKSLGIQELAKEKNAIILDHGDSNLSSEERLKVMRKELTSDLFLSSSNAVTINGELVNIDGAGNRVAAITFGPKKVILVVGINKITENLDSAFQRLKLTACPQNNKRLNKDNPCTKVGYCVECNSDSRICRIYSVIKRKPSASDITVVIVGENLGY